MRIRFSAIAILCVAAVVFSAEPADPEFLKTLDASIERGVKALVAKQSEDGAWRSETYGVFKPGVAATAFVLEALSRLPEEQRRPYTDRFNKAMTFLREATDQDGAVGMKGEWPEYPTYTTALCIMTWCRLKPEGWQETVKPWADWLISAQHSEDNGCKKDEPAYGGWNPQGRRIAGMPRHADISSTRHAMQGLGASAVMGVEEDLGKALNRGLEFMGRCSAKGDKEGQMTMFFSPTAHDLNKAGKAEDGKGFKGYASASADGWLILAAYPIADESKVLVSWSFDLNAFEKTPGIPGDQPERKNWDRAVIGYYRAAVSELAGGKLPFKVPEGWWQGLAAATIKDQSEGGLWKNEINYMKEDDPLIASPMALRTLLGCRAAISK